MTISKETEAKKLKREGLLDEAIIACRKAIEVNPSCDSYRKELGEILAEKGEWFEAIASYQKAIELNPKSALSYHNLGELFAKQGKLDKAAKFYRRGIEVEPEYYGFYQGLGEIFAERGALDKAVRFFQKAAELYQKLGDRDGVGEEYYYYLLALACSTNGRWEGAVENCRQAIALNPNNFQYYQLLCRCLNQLEKWDEAIAYCEKAMELDRTDENIYFWLGEILERKGKLQKAIAVYGQGVEIWPQNARMTSYLKVLKGKQTLSETYYNLADNLAKQGYLEEAIKAYHSSIQLNPDILEREESTENVVISIKALTERADRLEEILKLQNRFYLIEIEGEKKKYFELPKTIHEKIERKFVISASMIQKPVFLAGIPEGRCVMLHGNHKSVFNKENLLLKELCISNTNPSWFSESFQPLLKVDDILYLLVIYNQNYFHWMFEIIAPLKFLNEIGLNRKCKIAINYSESSFQKETLNQLGFKDEDIVNTKNYPHIKAKKLIVPHYGSEKVMQWSCEFLRKTFLPERSQGNVKGKRLYISRRKASYRRVINEAEVLEFLKQFGFIEVTLESMSVKEQALLLASAEVAIAPHGAGLTNLVFCTPGTKVIEIFSPEWVKVYFYLVCYYSGLDYYYLMGEKRKEKNKKLLGRCADIIVNVDLLSKLMGKAGIF